MINQTIRVVHRPETVQESVGPCTEELRWIQTIGELRKRQSFGHFQDASSWKFQTFKKNPDFIQVQAFLKKLGQNLKFTIQRSHPPRFSASPLYQRTWVLWTISSAALHPGHAELRFSTSQKTCFSLWFLCRNRVALRSKCRRGTPIFYFLFGRWFLGEIYFVKNIVFLFIDLQIVNWLFWLLQHRN